MKKDFTMYILDCFFYVLIEDQMIFIAAISNSEMDKDRNHLLKFWTKHWFAQIESEFTPRILKIDIPNFEVTNQERFTYYQEIMDQYSCLDLSKINSDFNSHIERHFKDILPFNKAKHLLSRLIITENSDGNVVLDHSFVQGTSRHIEFFNSKIFRTFLGSFHLNQKPVAATKNLSILQKSRRKSVMSNFNNRTYNKETLQEYCFGAFIFKISTFKTPLDIEYKVILIFEKTCKRKQKLHSKHFAKYHKQL